MNSWEAAFQAWDTSHESCMDTELRIHDGVEQSQLVDRGRRIAREIFERFPWVRIRPKGLIVELGSGMAYLMQGLMDVTGAERVTGVDVSDSMIESARTRLLRDGHSIESYEFRLSNGRSIPLQSNSVDFLYSVGCIQHIPKPVAYSLLLEIDRVLRPRGTAILHSLGWKHLYHQETWRPFRTEIECQLNGGAEHWHHFWSMEEWQSILNVVLRPHRFEVQDGEAIWTGFSKR